MSDSLQPHGHQTRPPYPSPTPRACSNSCPSSRWCHPTISSSVVPFSSFLQSFPASGSFPISRFFPSGGQSTVTLASLSVLPKNIQDWFPLGLTGWIDFLVVQGTLKSLLQHHSSKASILWCSAFFMVQLSHPCVTTGKTIGLTLKSPAEARVGGGLLQGRDSECSSVCTGPFGGGHRDLHHLHHSMVSAQTTGREHSPAHQQKIGLKIYWAWPRPSEQDPVSHSVRLSHQEASISLLSFSIRGWTDWKPQSQKTNQTDHMDHSLV